MKPPLPRMKILGENLFIKEKKCIFASKRTHKSRLFDMNIYDWIVIILPVLVSLFAVRWIYFKILKIAKVKNLVDNPDARKLQKTPVPVVGGLAVFFGLILGLLAGIA